MQALHAVAAEGALLHAHGLWRLATLYPAWAAARHGRPFLVSPRGMLGAPALAFSRTAKRVFWAAGQGRALRAAACLHATSEQELIDIRAAGLRGPVAVVPNGIDLPARRADAPPTAIRTALYLGRLHPKKGLDILLRAWARIEAARPDWRLRIVGPSESGHGEDLDALAARLGLRRARIEPPLYGADKHAAYAEADLFVLPTRHENFALTVAEALAAETPVVCTKGAPWEGLVGRRCGWWVDPGEAPLAEALLDATALPPEERAAMGARGRAWMAEAFAWPRLAADMAEVYLWASGLAARPPCVATE